MTSGMRQNRTLTYCVRLAQYLVGTVFVLSGLLKGIDPVGTSFKIGEYATAFGIPLPEQVALVAAVALNLIETLLGVCILGGVRRRLATLAMLLLMLPLTALTLYIVIANPVADCGCFGDAIKISNHATFWKNVVLLLATLLLFLFPTRLHRAVPENRSTAVLCVAVLLITYFNIYPILHLPVIDFRPYKVGTDLASANGTDGVYDYRFVYTKDGEERIFDLDEVAELDSTWLFVRDSITTVRPPQESPVADFLLLDRDGTPVTDMLTTPPARALLYITTDLLRLSDQDLSYALSLQTQTGEPVTIVMSNSFGDLSTQSNRVSPFGRILYLDRTAATTVIRANPGLLVLDQGKIVRKTAARDLPQLLKQATFRANPYTPETSDELLYRRGLTFGPILAGLLLLLIMGIYYRKESHES